MPQSQILVLSLFAAFFIYVTAKGKLPAYISVLV